MPEINGFDLSPIEELNALLAGQEDSRFQAAATAAATWWEQTFDGPSGNGGTDLANLAAADLLNKVRQEHKPSPAQREEFTRVLAGLIVYYLEKDAETISDPQLRFGVDYHADQILMLSASWAGIRGNDMTLFPFKSGCLVTEKEVRAYCGYGKSPETVYDASAPTGRYTRTRGSSPQQRGL